MNDSLIQQALADLSSGNVELRESALRSLRDALRAPLPDEAISTTLAPLLHDADPTIRRLTAEVLGRCGSHKVVDPLLDTLYDDQIAVRVAVIDALGLIGDRNAVNDLTEALYDESVYVRFAAAAALGQIGDPRAVMELIHMLDNDDIPVAMMAAQSLYKLGTPEALAAIQHLKTGEGEGADAYDFSVPPHLDITLPHMPLPSFDEVKPEQAAAEPPPINDELEETMRHIPSDLLRSLREADAADARESETHPTRSTTTEESGIAETDSFGETAMQKEDAESDGDLQKKTSELIDDNIAAPSTPPPPSPSTPPSQPAPAQQPAPAVPLAKPQIPTPGSAMSGPSAEPNPVTFSAYYPREAVPDVWYPLRAYVFRARAADAVTTDAARELGGLLTAFREVVRTALGSVTTGALITATPELPGFQFNPPSAQIGFYEDWHRFDFKLRPTAAAADQASNGRITFTVEGVIVADVPLSIYVGSNVSANVPGGDTTTSVQRAAYRAIFCSYSHRDTQIVERVERAYKALGLDFLRDVVTLKSGEDWNAELLAMIDRADIFQLFWSETAAQSQYVRQEWEHALSLGREQGFIRPVYWAQPLPPVPPELSAIHFAYEPTLID